ncbi:hypothetical protein FHG87_014639 [Trinorchestia longiramus]|nr:hypothetical protein FHG87_014639 [Trinorchestia longiramus]
MAALLLLLLACLGLVRGSKGQQQDHQDLLMNDVLLFSVTKRDLEFNQYVPAYRLRGEPSCEELRTMWRLSKREARRATSTNQLPRALPYRYGRLRAFAPPSGYGLRAHGFGAMKFDDRHRHGYRLPQTGAFNKLRSLIGTRRHGAFSELRDAVGKERTSAPEDNPRGQYDNLRGMLLKEYEEEQQTQTPVALSLRTRDNGARISSRRDSAVPIRDQRYQGEGFLHRLLPGNPKLGSDLSNQLLWTSSHDTISYNERDCSKVHMTDCHSDSECTCDGQFLCSNFRCVVIPQGVPDQFGIWYYEALPSSTLQRWSAQPRGFQ